MEKINGNDPIMPTTQKEWVNQGDTEMTVGVFGGLTKREYFAAMVLQGLTISSCQKQETLVSKIKRLLGMKSWQVKNGYNIEENTKSAILMADSLIEGLNK